MSPKQLHLHTSNRVENLATRLVEVASETPLSRPLSQETVMTLNPGIARWLQFEIAKRAGVSFGWDFPLPGKLFSRVLRGFEPSFNQTGVFPEDLARWHLHDILGKLEPKKRFEQVRAYCDPPGGTRRLSFAQRLTRLYDEYLVYRPDTVVAWEDEPEDSIFDWQAEIWRRLQSTLYPNSQQGRHIARIWDDLRRGRLLELNLNPQAWPERLFVFGVSSLAPLYLDFLDALAVYRPVHIFLLQPSDLYWADLKTTKQIQKIAQKAAAKKRATNFLTKSEDWLFETGNPLLPSLGKQSQMFLDLLIDKDPLQDDAAFVPPDSGYSQLATLQADLFAIEDRDLGKDKNAKPFPPYDGSLQIHACSSRRREVETVWDLLVARFEAEPYLKPNEILVMAPDIQVYRSHIEAVFEAKRGKELEIPYSVADGAAGNRPGVMSGLLAVFQSVSKRASSAEILALLETPLVREAFQFSERDLECIEFWIRELGITWGWNANHRNQHDCFATDRNTWREFRVRLLAGIAFSKEVPLPSGFLAYPEIEGELASTASRTVECLDLLFDLRREFQQIHPLEYWQSRILSALGQLRSERSDWEVAYLQATELVRETIPIVPQVEANGSEVYRAICEKLENSPSGGGYLSGGVTFCSLKPMRAIPANTVVLMGMNRNDFPRRSNRLSFDLLAKEPRIGDRNTREEDRQFYLETLLSVRQQLVITYQAVDSGSDTPREPSSVVEELLDYLENAMRPADFCRIHRRQKRLSFDLSYFDGGTQTFDPERANLRNRFAGFAENQSKPITLNQSENELPEIVTLDSLIGFFLDPSKTYATEVAKLKVASTEDSLSESDELSLGGLDRYKLQETFAQMLSRADDLDTIDRHHLSQAKLLPTGYLEEPTYQTEREKAQLIAESIGELEAEERQLQVVLAGSTLTGETTIRKQHCDQVLIEAGELKAKRVVAAWIRHLFASACAPEFKGETTVLSLHPKGKPIRLNPVPNATELLEDLVSLYQKGLREPLPFFPALSEYAFKQWQKASDKDESQILEAVGLKLWKNDADSDFFDRDLAWTAYQRVCFGDDYQPDRRFLEIALQIWEPCDAAAQTLKLESIGGGAK